MAGRVNDARIADRTAGAPELGELLPRHVKTAALGPHAPEPVLPPQESRHQARMVPARRRSFALGRVCARAALSALGVECAAIGVGSAGQPLWPAGTVGSISHCGGRALAIAAWRDDYRSLGLDMERATALEPAVEKLVCRPEERNDAVSRDHGDDFRGAIVFSAKESIYKCLWPLHKRYVDFQEVVVRLDPRTGAFFARSVSHELPAGLVESLEGRYAVRDGVVLSACWSVA